MSSYHSRASPGSTLMARHLDTLVSSFDLIGERLREAIANAVGRTVADGVSEAVHAVLSGPDAESRHNRPSDASGWSPRSSTSWGEPERPSWGREDYGHEDRFYPSRYDEPDPYDDDYPDYDSTAEPATERKHIAWAAAVTAGLQAAAWSLRRAPDQKSVAGSVSVGVVAFLLTWLGGPTAVAVAGLAASVLGLLSLPDLCSSGIGLLQKGVTP